MELKLKKKKHCQKVRKYWDVTAITTMYHVYVIQALDSSSRGDSKHLIDVSHNI